MFNKLIFYILLLLINSSLEYYASIFPQYGSVTVNGTSVLFLSLNGFKSNDTLYFETSFNNGFYYKSTTLGFWRIIITTILIIVVFILIKVIYILEKEQITHFIFHIL